MRLASFRRGRLKEIGYKPLHIVVVSQIDKGIVTMAAVHIDKVKHTHLIAFLFKQTADVTDNFALWVKHYKRGVALHSVWLAEKSRLTCTRAAAHKNVQISAVLFSVQTDTGPMSRFSTS